MPAYLVKMINTKSGKHEVYRTEAEDTHELDLGLDFLREFGYQIVEVRPA